MADHSPDDRIVPKAKAEAALAVVVQYLQEQEDQRDTDEDVDLMDEPKHWDDAKDWAHQLLNASGRDAWCGCPLCRS